jgi:L-aminopeptidase/D-esterase-like protein
VHTSQSDPRVLNVLTEDEYNRLAQEAADKAERAAIAAMTPAEQMNHRLEAVASRYGLLKPWAT